MLAATSAAAFLSGCASVNTVERQAPVAERQMVADKRIITDKTLDRIVGIVGVNEATIGTGFLKIQLELLNRTTSTQNFSYRVEWFDANGIVVNTPAAVWIERQILPQQTLAITAVAPTESTKDFRVQLFRK